MAANDLGEDKYI